MSKVIVLSFTVFLLLSFPSASSACSYPKEVGAAFSDIAQSASSVVYAEVIESFRVVAKNDDGVQVTRFKVVEEIKGTGLTEFSVIRNYVRADKVGGYAKTWYGCGLLSSFKKGQRYLFAPGFSRLRNSQVQLSTVGDAKKFYQEHSVGKILVHNEEKVDESRTALKLKNLAKSCRQSGTCKSAEIFRSFDASVFYTILNVDKASSALKEFAVFLGNESVTRTLEESSVPLFSDQVLLAYLSRKDFIQQHDDRLFIKMEALLAAWLILNKLEVRN